MNLFISFQKYQFRRNVHHKLLVQQAILLERNDSLEDIIAEKDRLLAEKEFLLKEMHHRVKNNLQLSISLLNSQANYLSNEEAVSAIRDSQHRLKSIAMVHQELYLTDDLKRIELKSYITGMINCLRDSFNTRPGLHFEIKIDQAEMEISRAVSLGLLVNEAITNVFKHAFREQQGGVVKVSIQRTGKNELKVLIKDNGMGLSNDLGIDGHKSMGIVLMKGLSGQLGGEFDIYNDRGTTVALNFVTFSL
jgi:two-component sensor histidine kinase